MTLLVNLPTDNGKDDGRSGHAEVAAPVESGNGDGEADEDTSPSPSPSSSPSTASPSASASAPEEGERQRDEADATGPAEGEEQGGDTASGPPLTVHTQPYSWESPCDARYLVDAPPSEVGPPPVEGNAAAWVRAEGAVTSGKQFIILTVQGTGPETVVVENISVRIAAKRSPLAWNDYAMAFPGAGCGGGVQTRTFNVALDAVRPGVEPEAGSDDFPYKVSESDPEVYYIRADASAYDVSWYLVLKWSSGSRQGTLVVDDEGRPFRTSGNNGRPAYEHPLDGSGWVEEGTTLGEQQGG
nr:hypothetical protein [Streptomyces ruber]